MCRVTVNCHCHHRTSGNGWIGLVALVALAFIVAPVIVAALKAAVDLLTAIVIGIVVAVSVIVVGWIVKNIAVTVIEERSLRRHNERMAQIHPHLRAHLQKVPRTRPQARAVAAPQPQPLTAPVRIYPTPRSELGAGRNREVV
jgi:uncharacterized membrane protein (DUF485 family)